jgi:hypothetical protein
MIWKRSASRSNEYLSDRFSVVRNPWGGWAAFDLSIPPDKKRLLGARFASAPEAQQFCESLVADPLMNNQQPTGDGETGW